MRSSWWLAAACFTIASALAAPASAQDVAAAEALYTRGLADMQAGRYETGCPALAESHRLDPKAGALFTLAECEAERGRLATAVARYGDFLAFVARMPPEQQAKQQDRAKTAAEKKATLGPLVPELTLMLPPNAPAGTVVKRDGVALAGPSLGIGLPVDPGEHVVTIEAPGGAVSEVRVNLEKGEKKQLTLEVKAPGSKPAGVGLEPVTPKPADQNPPPHASKGSPSARRIGAYVTGGVGLAGLVVGGIMGGMALSKKSIITAHCDAEKLCDATGKSAADSGQSLALVSTIGVGVGLAGIGVATALLLSEPAKQRRAPARTMTPLQVRVATLSLGQGGALVSLKGDW